MHGTRRQFMASAMGAVLALRFPRRCGASERGTSRPNILVMVGEDHGLQLSCYCSPSRASILTGLYPHNNGQIGLATHGLRMYQDDTPNLTTYLKAAGYRTGIIGKIHVNPESAFSFDFKAFPGSNFNKRFVERFARAAGEFFRASADVD